MNTGVTDIGQALLIIGESIGAKRPPGMSPPFDEWLTANAKERIAEHEQAAVTDGGLSNGFSASAKEAKARLLSALADYLVLANITELDLPVSEGKRLRYVPDSLYGLRE